MAGSRAKKSQQSLDNFQSQYKKIGKELKRLRVKAGYTAALDFAYEHELPVSQYARYEAGSNMKLDSLIKVLAKHNLTLEEFFKGIK